MTAKYPLGTSSVAIVTSHNSKIRTKKSIFFNPASHVILCVISLYAVSRETLRLSSGYSKYEGRVEVFINGIWGSICDNGWSLPEADVVCRELGHPRDQSVRKGAWFGEGDESS